MPISRDVDSSRSIRWRPRTQGRRATSPSRTRDALAALLDGDDPDLDSIPIDVADRPAWDRLVLDGVRTIPRGATASYGEVARRIGRPGAARAVGGAVGRSPIGLLVPCHRVIAGDGTLGGYGAAAWGGARPRSTSSRRSCGSRASRCGGAECRQGDSRRGSGITRACAARRMHSTSRGRRAPGPAGPRHERKPRWQRRARAQLFGEGLRHGRRFRRPQRRGGPCPGDRVRRSRRGSRLGEDAPGRPGVRFDRRGRRRGTPLHAAGRRPRAARSPSAARATTRTATATTHVAARAGPTQLLQRPALGRPFVHPALSAVAGEQRLRLERRDPRVRRPDPRRVAGDVRGREAVAGHDHPRAAAPGDVDVEPVRAELHRRLRVVEPRVRAAAGRGPRRTRPRRTATGSSRPRRCSRRTTSSDVPEVGLVGELVERPEERVAARRQRQVRDARTGLVDRPRRGPWRTRRRCPGCPARGRGSETISASGARAWMMPAHAVPWPTTSIGWVGTTSQSSPTRSTATLSTSRPPTRRVVALDARVDDRDAHAAAAPVAERPRRGRRGPTARRGRRRLAVALGERLAPGRQVEAHRRNERGAGRADAPRERLEDLDHEAHLVGRRVPGARHRVGQGPQAAAALVVEVPGDLGHRDRRLHRPSRRPHPARRRGRASAWRRSAGRVPLDRGWRGSRPPPGGRTPRRGRGRAACSTPRCRPSRTSSTPMLPAVVEDRDREDRARGRSRWSPPRAVEARVRRHVGRPRAAARSRTRSPRSRCSPRMRARRRAAPCGPAATRMTSWSVSGLVEGDGRGLRAEHEDGGVDDRAQHRLAARAARGGTPTAARAATASRREASCPSWIGHRRASWVSRRASGTTSVSGSNRMSPLADEVREQPVHGLPRAPDHAGELGLGVGPVEPDLALVGAARVGGALGGPREVGDPLNARRLRQVEEVERLDVIGEAAQLAGEGEDERATDRRLGLEQPLEVRRGRGRASRSARSRRPCAECGCPSSIASSPKNPPRAERGEDGAGSPVSGDGRTTFTRPARDDVQRVAGVALVEHRLVAPEAAEAEAREARVEARPRRHAGTARIARARPGEVLVDQRLVVSRIGRESYPDPHYTSAQSPQAAPPAQAAGRSGGGGMVGGRAAPPTREVR